MPDMLSTSGSPPNPSIPEGHVPRYTTSAIVSHHAHTPNIALDHAKTIQQLLEEILLQHRCYGTYTIHAEFDENMARTGQGLLPMIVISLDAIWCSKNLESDIGLAAWPFVTKLHMKPLPLPRRTIRVAPIAPRPSDPSTSAIPGPSPTLSPFLGRSNGAHAFTDDDKGIDTLAEIEHVDDVNTPNNSEKWRVPIHSSVEGDYAVSLDSQIHVEAVPRTGKQFVHFGPDVKPKRSYRKAAEFPCITVSMTPLQLAIPRAIDKKTTRLVSLSKLPTLITSNVRARVGRVLNLNLPEDCHSSLQATSYIVKDNYSIRGTISSVEKTLHPVNIGLKQGHVDIHGRSCNAELDWCYNLAKPCRMHSITMKDPARATFILCGPKPDDWPLMNVDFVALWRLQNEESTMSKIFSSFPCAQAKEPTNAYRHVAHRVSAQIDLDDMMHHHAEVSGLGHRSDTTNEAPIEPSRISGSDTSHPVPISRPASTTIENQQSCGLHFMFMHALKGKIQKKKSTVQTKAAPNQPAAES